MRWSGQMSPVNPLARVRSAVREAPETRFRGRRSASPHQSIPASFSQGPDRSVRAFAVVAKGDSHGREGRIRQICRLSKYLERLPRVRGPQVAGNLPTACFAATPTGARFRRSAQVGHPFTGVAPTGGRRQRCAKLAHLSAQPRVRIAPNQTPHKDGYAERSLSD